jgi:hypothetical protein
MFLVNLNELNWSGYGDLQEFVSFLLNFLICFSGVVASLSILSSGFSYMLSMGNPDKVSKASKSLGYSILGLILVFLSPTIIQFVLRQILGVSE